MEENTLPTVMEGEIIGIRFGLASRHEICTASNSDCPISHASQLTNPFLGLPLEHGKCESCGTAEPGQCEGHFGYIELPIPIYHPCHISELKRMLSLLCLKCLRMQTKKSKIIGLLDRSSNASSCNCEETSLVSVKEVKTTDGACYLELKVPSRSRLREGFWNFLDRYGFHYGDRFSRPLLPLEVKEILRRIPEDTKKKLARKGYFPQDGFILQYIPVPPNCLSVPDISDGVSIMSSDLSISMLKKVLKQVEIIKSSRSGIPNFESHEVEANELQAAVAQYLSIRGTAKASRDIDARFGISKETNGSSTKAWLEKIRTLFIRKGSGFSSRSVITGDAYIRVNEIGIPFEIAQRITFEEKVNIHNKEYLQKLVDEKLCLTYRDGLSTYSLREGSKGHTFLRPGQVVHRRIMDGDIVFINRPPTTHKHSLQAFSVYVHDDHTVKINPLICGPLSADFDGDCVHLFYPQSLSAKAEVLELFSVDKQLLSSHSGCLNLQLATDSLLSLKILFMKYFLERKVAHQLAMFVSSSLPQPALIKSNSSGPLWTAAQILQTALPVQFDCNGDRYLIQKSEILKFDVNRDVMQSVINEIVSSVFLKKGSQEALKVFNSLQPLLMENLFSEGFSVGLKEFSVPSEVLQTLKKNIQDISPLLHNLRSSYNELVELQLENHLRLVKVPVSKFILKSSSMGILIDSMSDSAMNKIVQQIGFLGLQISDKGKFYTKTLFDDMASLFKRKYPLDGVAYPSEELGLIKSCFFHGLNPFEEMVHSISSREVIVRSSRGLTEPGTLFKNLMAILRDVAICYDGTVRNVCSNSVIQLQYETKKSRTKGNNFFPAGEPVGVLAATAISNPAYKAVLDSSPSSNSSWELMKEILLCKVNFRNDLIDRRVILYLNDCGCGRKYCRENATYFVKNHLKKVSLKDVAADFMIEYNNPQSASENLDKGAVLIGHVHLNKVMLKAVNRSMDEVLEKCRLTIDSLRKNKKVGFLFKRIVLSVSECCCFGQSCESKWSDLPCLKFFLQETNDDHLEKISHLIADTICPILLQTIIKGDPRVSTVNITWISPDTMTWIRNSSRNQKGELALEITLEKAAVKQSGDAWRIVLDSCLPVLHLIDTSRSIPYAIKQVQELLGISCAFEQAIKRLSSSVRMVAKGVLKEHLILLANSMTCGGSLVGFNTGGYKALSRSLNVQVPFTEATLFTPRKCFERSAEKHHIDSLSSIVASCSWGKHVAVGTGSRFDVLWDKKASGMNQEAGIDVYNFLHLVRSASTSKRDEVNTSGLGEDVDDLELYDDNFELALSPERDSISDKPVFEDNIELNDALENNHKWNSGEANWETVSSSKPASWSGWGTNKVKSGAEEEPSKADGWDLTASGKGLSQSSVVWGKKVEGDKPGNVDLVTGSSDWDNKVAQEKPSQSAWTIGGWSKDTLSTKESQHTGEELIGKASSPQWDQQKGILGRKPTIERASPWGASNESTQLLSSLGWGDQAKAGNDVVKYSMGKKEFPFRKGNSESSSKWGSSEESTQPASPGWDAQKTKVGSESFVQSQWGQSGKKAELHVSKDNTENSANWGSSNESTQPASSPGWDAPKNSGNESVAQSQWGKRRELPVQKDSNECAGNWGSSTEPTQPASSPGWEASKAKLGIEIAQSQWGQKRELPVNKDNNEGSSNWSSPSNSKQQLDSPGWDDIPKGKTGNDRIFQSQQGQKKDLPSKEEDVDSPSGGWGSSYQSPKLHIWDSPKGGQKEDLPFNSTQIETPKNWGSSPNESSLPVSSDGWDSPSAGAGNIGESQWGQQTGGFKKRWPGGRGGGGSNAGEWKNKNNRPNKPPGMPHDDSNISAIFTATRQRLDMFTSEEQDILSDIEPIMLSIRRIMHQSGYNDGDPLTADDQAYIVDNVFNYHPDKAAKMGSGIDHVMVSKHSSFQESRCFYIVSTDGRKEDFSYRKCLENFIREKYPDLAEAFNGKYFRKPRNRENSRAGTPTPMEQ